MNGWSSDYYKLPKGAKELQDLIEHKNMNFAVANIFKAAYRLGDKDGTTEEYDLNKVIWFAQRELNRIERENEEDLLPRVKEAVYVDKDVDVHTFMRALRLDPDQ